MLPIDEDILQSRYGDDPVAAEWYRHWRKMGAQPDEAIQVVDELRVLIDRIRPFLLPSISQQQALQRCADACAGVIGVFRGLEAYQPPSDQDLAAFEGAVSTFADALTAEQIERLVNEAQHVAQLFRKQLAHSQRSSTDTANSKP